MEKGQTTLQNDMSLQPLRESLQRDFHLFESLLNGQKNSFVHERRREAFAAFEEQEFPTVRHEEWKYTNVIGLTKHKYTHILAAESIARLVEDNKEVFEEAIKPYLHVDIDTMVFVNGHYAEPLSQFATKAGSANTIVSTFSQAISEHQEILEKQFSRYANNTTSIFTAMNTAFARDGFFLHLGKSAILERPVQVISITDARAGQPLTQPRNLIRLEANSEAKIIIRPIVLGEENALVNTVTEVSLAQDARLNLTMMQNGTPASHHIESIEVHQEERSHFTANTFSFSGKMVRNNLHAESTGDHTETNMWGLVCLQEKYLTDNHTLMDHAAPNCESNEFYKHVLDDKATAVFNGKIIVRPDSQKINAYQSNRILLLSNNATVNTKPQLEIFADDVKCSHGAVSGQLDEESLFYLRSRGLPEESAKALLTIAFAGEIVEKLPFDFIRDEVNAILEERYGA